MICSQNEMIIELKERLRKTYNWLSIDEINQIFNFAFSDYLMLKYPSDNNKPKIDDFGYNYFNTQWIYKRMIDILGRAGGISVSAYKENGLNITYGASYIDPQLASEITPKAGVPR